MLSEIRAAAQVCFAPSGQGARGATGSLSTSDERRRQGSAKAQPPPGLALAERNAIHGERAELPSGTSESKRIREKSYVENELA